ncbi:MAG: Asp-tRNA(Asn)/Glu-tRNA(Gln) amidotransferase subunit GatA [Desulfovibrio sp.]|jgi:aspartyl-tRNA(Asn)/glutamyl-tRNA(Gln) amidotransferase subunit A|nr:Asp-tRNA(Asn)/Glu-tRNA(Gln) amidotransferase subunit GatA [Desulfovibrio sp.]
MTPLHTHNLTGIRDMLGRGEVRPSEVLESCLERLENTEPQIHACLTVCADDARAQAAALEAEGRSSPAKALWGVPLTVKDVLCTKGVRTTAASRILENFVPPYDAFAVERLKAAGAIIMAKTNLDEFAMGSSTEFSAFGGTNNPWDTARIPGGSSGGSAASVAARQCFGSLGTDTGGSIRQPAGLCGCVGIKPTYGRVSRYGAIAYGSSFDQIGPLARTVRDCALLLSVIAGYDPRDATSCDTPVRDYTAAAGRVGLSGITLGLPVEYWGEGLSAETEKACRAAVNIAADLGAKIKEISLPSLPYGIAAYYILASAEASTNLARYDGMRFGLRVPGADLAGTYVASRSKGFGEEAQRRILLGTYALSSGYYDAYYTKAAKVRRLIAEDFAKALEQCNALLAPVSPVTAWKPGSVTDPLSQYKMDILTIGLNLAGLPGLALPAGLGEDSGLPVGLQIFGRAFDEAGIIGIASALESALPGLGEPKGLL